jgi:hypothetical protein
VNKQSWIHIEVVANGYIVQPGSQDHKAAIHRRELRVFGNFADLSHWLLMNLETPIDKEEK